jgi:hypothetical protein
LNPDDADEITLLANEKSSLKVHGKGEGVEFKASNAPESIALPTYAVFIIAALGALLALLGRPLIARLIGRGPA